MVSARHVGKAFYKVLKYIPKHFQFFAFKYEYKHILL